MSKNIIRFLAHSMDYFERLRHQSARCATERNDTARACSTEVSNREYTPQARRLIEESQMEVRV